MDTAAPQPHRSSTLPPPRPTRPKFNSMLTSDRLRESYLFRAPARTPDPLAKPRRSVFRETGLDDDDVPSPAQTPSSPPADVFGGASPVDKATPAWPGERVKEMKGRGSEEAARPKMDEGRRGGLCL